MSNRRFNQLRQKSVRKSHVRVSRFEPLEARRMLALEYGELGPNDSLEQAMAIEVSGERTTIHGNIDSSGDLDFFEFTLTNDAGVFFDIDARETGLSNLDSIVRVYNSSGTQIDSNNNGYDFDGFKLNNTSSTSDSSDSSLYSDLSAGTYRVSVEGSSSSSGLYDFILYSETSYSTTVPIFNSNLGASDTLYLDFNGHSSTNDTWANSKGAYSIATFDFDNNSTSFSPAEQMAMENIWRVVAEDYSLFNVNVTTVDPGSFNNAQAYHLVIGGSGSDLGYSGGTLGVAYRNSYASGSASDNVGFVFAESFSYYGNESSDQIMAQALEMGNTGSHEFGHALRLRHYGGSNALKNGIMNTPDFGLNREIWQTGDTHSGESSIVFQDDIATISSSTNTFGLRSDDHGDSIGSATVMSEIGGIFQADGILTSLLDADYFQFSASGDVSISVLVDEYSANLNAELRVYNSSGQLIATDAPTQSLGATTTLTLAAGDYFIEVVNSGNYGELGQYSVLVEAVIIPPGFALTESSGSTRVSESGTSDSFDVVLTSQPLSDVVLTIDSSNTNEATVDKTTLTFTTANWNVAQTVTVTGVDDLVIDGNQISTITVSVDDTNSDNAFDTLVDQAVTVTVTDNDAASPQGLNFNNYVIDSYGGESQDAGGIATVEDNGATLHITGNAWKKIDFAYDITADTILEFDFRSPTQGEIQGIGFDTDLDISAEYTFQLYGTQAWRGNDYQDYVNTAPEWQHYTIPVGQFYTGSFDYLFFANDDDVVNSNAEAFFSNITVYEQGESPAIAGYNVTESDNDTSVSESGTSDSFDIVLTSQPLTDVVLTITNDDTGEATVDKTTLTFTTANWNVAQTVTVTGVDDLVVDGNQNSIITVSVNDTNSDDAFDMLVDQAVTVTVTDNDAANFSITESAGNTSVSESGTSDSFDVVLTSQPLSDVVLTIDSSNTNEATVDKTTLTFTTANWNVAQTVTVTGVDDLVIDGNQISTITVSVDDTNSDNAFDTLVDQAVTVTVTDNDAASPQGLNLNNYVIDSYGGESQDAGGIATVEDSGATLHITGNAWKKIDFAYDITADTILEFDFRSPTQGEIHGIGFDTDLNISAEYTFQLYGTQAWRGNDYQDYVNTAPEWQHYTIPVGQFYTGSFDYLFFANDDDVANSNAEAFFSNITVYEQGGSPAIAGYSVTESDNDTSVSESGTSDSFDIILTSQPLTDVVLTIESSDTGEATVDKTTLTFTTANWNVAQTVTVTGVDDLVVDGNQNSIITVSVNDTSSDDAFDTLVDQAVTVTVIDNDAASPQGLNLNNYVIGSYGGSQDAGGIATVEDSGATLHITGNAWKKIDFSYDITKDTILEFDFLSPTQGEIHGIGFDTNLKLSPQNTFRLYGTQNWGLNEYDTYEGTTPKWQHYTIPVGQFYTGSFDYLFFASDHDVSNPNADAFFSNITVYEQGELPSVGDGYEFDASSQTNKNGKVIDLPSKGKKTSSEKTLRNLDAVWAGSDDFFSVDERLLDVATDKDESILQLLSNKGSQAKQMAHTDDLFAKWDN